MSTKGYVATTTKDIARVAGVNESTLFRKFKGKKDIVLSGMQQKKAEIEINDTIFTELTWDLQEDLVMFLTAYMKRITPEVVNLSVGLRAPQIFEETAPYIMGVPQAFITMLVEYLQEMEKRGKIASHNFEAVALTIFSAVFGFTFTKATFEDKLTSIEREAYIKESVELFCKGLIKA